MAGARFQRSPMYNHDGVKIIDNFKTCFFIPSIVKIPINADEFFLRARYVGMVGGPTTRGTINIFRK